MTLRETTGPQTPSTAHSPANGQDGVTTQVVEVDSVPMSALIRRVPNPRAVVVALHGGSALSQYFHHPGQPRMSLLDTGAALGFTVLALDRPGYGASTPWAGSMTSPQRRVELSYRAVDRLLAEHSPGAGLFVLAHSAGCELAVRMAAASRPGLLGIELSGTGRRHHPDAVGVVDTTRLDFTALPHPASLRGLLWNPEWLYPDEVLGGRHFGAPSPAYETQVAANWATTDFARLAREIRVPVRYTLAEHERIWLSGPDAMADIAGLFTASPRVITHQQHNGGHNLSVGHASMAYHLSVLSFVEECVVAAQYPTTGR